MEFFNKKEDVLDFRLTEYGKYLLAIGRLKPVYYCFFDDDILYDVSGSGMTENQNMTEVRIQSETPTLKPIPTRTSAETRVNSYITQVANNLGPNSDPADNLDAFKVEVFEEKGKISAYPLGRSSLTSQFNPAWSIEILSTPNLASAAPYLNTGYSIIPGTGSDAGTPIRVSEAGTTSGSIENIPQLNINLNYNIYYTEGTQFADGVGDPAVAGIPLPGDATTGPSLYLAIEHDYLVLEVFEKNTDFEKENFDIEVYHEEPDGTYVQLAYGAAAPDSVTSADLPIQNDLNVPGSIGYYMNVLVDLEIPDSIIEQLAISEKAVTTNASRLRLNRDIYTTDPEEPC